MGSRLAPGAATTGLGRAPPWVSPAHPRAPWWDGPVERKLASPTDDLPGVPDAWHDFAAPLPTAPHPHHHAARCDRGRPRHDRAVRLAARRGGRGDAPGPPERRLLRRRLLDLRRPPGRGPRRP